MRLTRDEIRRAVERSLNSDSCDSEKLAGLKEQRSITIPVVMEVIELRLSASKRCDYGQIKSGVKLLALLEERPRGMRKRLFTVLEELEKRARGMYLGDVNEPLVDTCRALFALLLRWGPSQEVWELAINIFEKFASDQREHDNRFFYVAEAWDVPRVLQDCLQHDPESKRTSGRVLRWLTEKEKKQEWLAGLVVYLSDGVRDGIPDAVTELRAALARADANSQGYLVQGLGRYREGTRVAINDLIAVVRRGDAMSAAFAMGLLEDMGLDGPQYEIIPAAMGWLLFPKEAFEPNTENFTYGDYVVFAAINLLRRLGVERIASLTNGRDLWQDLARNDHDR